jgi:hypothetical protein
MTLLCVLPGWGNNWWYPYSTPITLPSGSRHQTLFDLLARRPTA